MSIEVQPAERRKRRLRAPQTDDSPRRIRRLAANLSIRDVERLTGINRGLLSAWERGMSLPPEWEQRINQLLSEHATKEAFAEVQP